MKQNHEFVRNISNSLQPSKLLLINAGSNKKRFILQRLKKLDYHLTVLDREKNWAKRFVDHWLNIDTTNHNGIIKAIRNHLKSNQIDGILTFWEDDVLLTSKIIDELGFIGISYQTACLVRNKFRFRDFCRKNFLPTPNHKLIQSSKDLQWVKGNMQFPVVIKPAYGSSSSLVVKVFQKENLEEIYGFVKDNISTQKESALQDGLDIFIEEYIDGEEVDIDILLQNGKIKFVTVSDNFDKSQGIFFIDKGQSTPSNLPLHTQKQLIEMAELILEKLGIFNACIHFEAKYTKTGPMPLEINLRMGGDYVYSYIKSAWNVDLIDLSAKIATGTYFKIKPRELPKKYMIGWDLHPQISGILTELDIDPKLDGCYFFEDLVLYKQLGDAVLVPPEGNENLGWLTISGENPLDVKDNLEEALHHVDFRVTKFDVDSSLGKTYRKNRFSLAKLDSSLPANKIEKIQRITKKDLKNLNIGLIHNIYHDPHHAISQSIIQTVEDLKSTLLKNDYKLKAISITEPDKLMQDLKKYNIDIVINLSRNIDGNTLKGFNASLILDTINIPYTGSDNFPITVTEDKVTFKKLLTFHEIPTPDWDYVYSPQEKISENLSYPLIVKPSNQSFSIGIDQEAVIYNQKKLLEKIPTTIKKFGPPLLVEEFAESDEFDVFIVGNSEDDLQVYPLVKITYPKDDNYPLLYSYKTRWNSKAGFCAEIPAKRVGQKLEKLITEIAMDTYSVTRCKDYGMVKVKMDQDRNPYVIGIDLWPDLGRDSIFAHLAKITKMSYLDLIEEIILTTINSYKEQK